MAPMRRESGRGRGHRLTRLVIPSLLSPAVFPFSIPKFILIYASFPPWGSELEKKKKAMPDPNTSLSSVHYFFT